ncbi:expressed unknown protein [Seminavis robusta]|uniref:Uncharacterized protein n=1 Tax=Seminavis robusta TaxID=568900 RepID=A0A9N8D561_9STRA|nr:expressed unknown protein [Seminavis robusta]|eukprot:Sro7_g006360.1 n/a (188) ;mRNA; f:248738-249301
MKLGNATNLGVAVLLGILASSKTVNAGVYSVAVAFPPKEGESECSSDEIDALEWIAINAVAGSGYPGLRDASSWEQITEPRGNSEFGLEQGNANGNGNGRGNSRGLMIQDQSHRHLPEDCDCQHLCQTMQQYCFCCTCCNRRRLRADSHRELVAAIAEIKSKGQRGVRDAGISCVDENGMEVVLEEV